MKTNQTQTIRWGILACGKIAQKFASDLANHVPNAVLQAVASRSLDKAIHFGQQFNVPQIYGSYEELVTCNDVTVIYIASPHAMHYEHTLLCLNAGKAVLCEKAFAINVEMVKGMIAKASHKNLFLMEAIWTRFNPCIEKMLQIIQEGTIGDIVNIQADFGFLAPYNPESRLFNPQLTGGALYDIGIYPLYISHLLLGKPSLIKAIATLAPTGVDTTIVMALQFTNGATATLLGTFMTHTNSTCTIYGTLGTIHLHSRFHESEKLSLRLHNKETEIFDIPKLGYGYSYEINEVNHCLQTGKNQSDKLPLSVSLELMESMCEVRHQIGLVYPQEIES